MLHFIYVLKDPRTGDVRYVGLTNNPAIRYQQHLQSSSGDKQSWIAELSSEGIRPLLEIIETVETKVQAETREQYWIYEYRGRGADLLNVVTPALHCKDENRGIADTSVSVDSLSLLRMKMREYDALPTIKRFQCPEYLDDLWEYERRTFQIGGRPFGEREDDLPTFYEIWRMSYMIDDREHEQEILDILQKWYEKKCQELGVRRSPGC